ncbi:uncharacterized protein [Dysidea avara]|uniref:uncharacterized protein n=1 Tax=Dysidea avara TaxID=196820 RepID=UPI003334997C
MEKAKAPTTVESLEVDAYVVDIKSEENPFAKTLENSDDDSNVFCQHKYRGTTSRRMRRTADEKIRRRSLKQAQLALHQELQPYTHKRPILGTILCTATEEIKKLKHITEENENCLSTLKKEKDCLTEKLQNLLEKFSGDSETHSSSDGRIGSDDSHENDECGEHQSMCTCETSLDDLQSNASEQHVEQNQTKDCGRMVVEDNQGNQKYPATDSNQLLTSTNPLFPSPLYCATTAQLTALQAQSIQLAQLQTLTNPIWLPPFVWPNLNSLYSTATGNQVNGTNSLYEKQHLQVVNGHEEGSGKYSTAVKCSVIKTIGKVDNKRNQSCTSPKSKAPVMNKVL